MGSALWIAISGLNASSKELDVIGNNIANSNTMGFKTGKTYFANVLSQSLSGGSSGMMQIGQGVTVADVATQFSQGSLESTASGLDLAVDGSGFFIAQDSGGSSYYTRAGAMHIDGNGYLVDINNYRIQGYAPGSASLGDVNTSGAQSAPVTTDTFSVGLNLDARAVVGDSFYSSQTVYDSLGAAHTLAVTYTKTEGDGTWGAAATLDGNAVVSQNYSGFVFDGSGNLDTVYNSTATGSEVTAGSGTVSGVAVTPGHTGNIYQSGTVTLTRGASADAWGIASVAYPTARILGYGTAGSDDTLTIDLDNTGTADITISLANAWASGDTAILTLTQTAVTPADISVTVDGTQLANGATIGTSNSLTWDITSARAQTITGYASASAVKALYSDGYPSGVLKSLAVEGNGTITGYFTNGQTTALGQIALADFANPWGLKKMGQNLFSETLTSGQAIINVPGSGGLGEVKSNSLEMSNTDIGTEFINMITAQRAYQASAKIITTTDEMMTALMNTKR
jgi:flagellar hook protein FlgE